MEAEAGLPALAASPADLQAAILGLARAAASDAAPGTAVSLRLVAAPRGARLHIEATPPGAAPPDIFLPAATP